MSLARLRTTLEDLPYVLREQILGYADSVRMAAPKIAQDAGAQFTEKLADQLAYLAGIRKLHAIVSSTYWTLSNSTALLRDSDVEYVRIGGRDYSRNSESFASLRSALLALDHSITKQGIKDYLDMPFVELVKALTQDGLR